MALDHQVKMPNLDRHSAKVMKYSDYWVLPLESNLNWFKSYLCVLPAVRLWSSYRTSQSLSFFTCKKRIIIILTY